jgi:hypothetical protein
MQRSLIEKVLTQHCGQSLKGILSGTLRRAAAALSMMAEQVRTQEQAQHLDYNAPYRTSHIVDSLTERAGMLWRTVEKIESEGWYWNAPSHSVPDCEWLPAVAKIEGPLFKVEAAPVAATAPEKIKPDAAAPAKRPDIAVVTLEEARRSRSMQRRPIATVAAMAAFQPFESALRGAAERAGNSGHQV